MLKKRAIYEWTRREIFIKCIRVRDNEKYKNTNEKHYEKDKTDKKKKIYSTEKPTCTINDNIPYQDTWCKMWIELGVIVTVLGEISHVVT